MIQYLSLDDVSLEDACLTIGTFDGLHRGHQEIIRQLTAGALESGAPAVVLTFRPPPSVVLGKREQAQYLTSPDELAALLEGMGVDVLIIHPFDRALAALSAREFIEILKVRLRFRALWIGYDFAMGRDRQGDAAALEKLGLELGYRLRIIPAVEVSGDAVSSSQIRARIAEGEVAEAARMLGRPYRLEGVVVRGEGRGKSIGIPTANLLVPADRALPGNGVYVCRAQVEGESLGAAANIGVRPTFDGQGARVTIEAHLLDFDGDLYGESLSLEFLRRLRGERRFPDAQALVAQILADIAEARQVLMMDAPSGPPQN